MNAESVGFPAGAGPCVATALGALGATDQSPEPLGAGVAADSVDAPDVVASTATSPSATAGAPGTPEPPVYRGLDGRLWVVVRGRSHALDGRNIRNLVRYELLRDGDSLPSSDQVRSYVDRLLARAYSAPTEDNFVRVCRTSAALYVDLAGETAAVVEVTAAGWRVIEEPPVRFVRPAGTRPLPTPVSHGDYRDLKRYFRLGEPAFHLLIANLTFQFCHSGPHPVMVFSGEQGVAKSTSAKLVQMLCDPRTPAVRQPPASRRDLMIAASHSWVLSFDNLSGLKQWFSDALCMLATGGGFGARTGHTDAEETTFDLLRPIVLGGIENFVQRDDLRDRCIFYDLEMIPDEDRIDEATLFAEFEAARPGVLGSLFELCAGVLRELPSIKPARLPRMADFFKWALAVERAAGWLPGTIEHAYRDQREAGDVDAMEDNLVSAICKLTETHRTWSGTATELLTTLRADATGVAVRWPRSPALLGAELRRQGPLLRRNGVDVRVQRSGTARTIFLARNAPAGPSRPSLPSPQPVPVSVAFYGAVQASDDGDRSDGGAGASAPQETPATAVALHGPQAGRPTAAWSSSSPSRPPQGPAALRMFDDRGDRDHEEHAGDMAAPTESNQPQHEAPGVSPRLLGSSEPARQSLPPRRRNIQDVLRGKQLTAVEVVEGLRRVGTLPDVQDPVRYVGQELSYGVRDGHWARVSRGVYTS